MRPLRSQPTPRPRRRGTAAWLGLALAWVSLMAFAPALQAQVSMTDRALPEFANQDPALWVNSKPLKKADLKGKVLLLEVWTSV